MNSPESMPPVDMIEYGKQVKAENEAKREAEHQAQLREGWFGAPGEVSDATVDDTNAYLESRPGGGWIGYKEVAAESDAYAGMHGEGLKSLANEAQAAEANNDRTHSNDVWEKIHARLDESMLDEEDKAFFISTIGKSALNQESAPVQPTVSSEKDLEVLEAAELEKRAAVLAEAVEESSDESPEDHVKVVNLKDVQVQNISGESSDDAVEESNEEEEPVQATKPERPKTLGESKEDAANEEVSEEQKSKARRRMSAAFAAVRQAPKNMNQRRKEYFRYKKESTKIGAGYEKAMTYLDKKFAPKEENAGNDKDSMDNERNEDEQSSKRGLKVALGATALVLGLAVAGGVEALQDERAQKEQATEVIDDKPVKPLQASASGKTANIIIGSDKTDKEKQQTKEYNIDLEVSRGDGIDDAVTNMAVALMRRGLTDDEARGIAKQLSQEFDLTKEISLAKKTGKNEYGFTKQGITSVSPEVFERAKELINQNTKPAKQ